MVWTRGWDCRQNHSDFLAKKSWGAQHFAYRGMNTLISAGQNVESYTFETSIICNLALVAQKCLL